MRSTWAAKGTCSTVVPLDQQVNRIVWYAGLYSASAALLKLAGFALFLWIARTLQVSDYATFGLLYAVQTGMITFAIAGIVEAVVGLSRERRSVVERRALRSGKPSLHRHELAR